MSSAGGRTGKLRSLWDMLELDAHRFVGLMNMLRSITAMGREKYEQRNEGGHGDAGFADSLREHAEQLAEMKLPASRGAVMSLAYYVERYGPYNDLANGK